MSLHGDRILAALETGDATSPVTASWRRSSFIHGLDPDSRAGPERDRSALEAALERDAHLITTAQPYLELIFDALGDPEAAILVADRHGLILSLRSGRTQDVWKKRPWQWVGTDVSERRIGTNGTGTCLADQHPVAIRGGEHFLDAITNTACFAAPVFGPDGALTGCINAVLNDSGLSDPRLEAFFRMTLATFARRIEIELFAAAFPRERLVLASPSGREPCAVLAIDHDDVVIGATRRARQLLKLSDATLARGVDLQSLGDSPRSDRLAEAERKLITRALARHGGNISAAARDIGISRSTLYRKLAALAAVGLRRNGRA